MPFSRQQRIDDEVLKDYLFGDLSSDETERLDELSIVDDDFAARLDTVESDLVDAYVRGELSGETLEKFQNRYLSSERRRERVAFAESLYSIAGKYNPQRAADRQAPAKSARSSWRDWFAFPRLAWAGGLAMLLIISFLLVDNLRLRDKASQSAADRAALQQRERDLQAQLSAEHAANAKTGNGLDQVRKSPAQPDNRAVAHLPSLPVSVAAFVLAPQMRGGTQIPNLSLPQETTRVDFRLDLETNDYPHYRVTLKSLKTDKPLWHSGNLAAVTKGESSTLSISLPAKLLKQEMYQLDLTGTPSSGEAEFVSSYVFRIVTQ
jgi:anti-sigma factor RsiW